MANPDPPALAAAVAPAGLDLTGSHLKLAEKCHFDARIAEDHARKAANWFYAVAAFSGFNTVALLTRLNWRFIAGLGCTRLVDVLAMVLARHVGPVAHLGAVGLDIAIVGTWVLIGMWARRPSEAAFRVGGILYFLDAILLGAAFHDWVGVGFHMFILIAMQSGVAWLRVRDALCEAVAGASASN